MVDKFGKASHTAALRSANYFNTQLTHHNQAHTIKTHLFTADATNPQELTPHLKDQHLDLIISDIPYGQRSAWQPPDDSPGSPIPGNQLTRMLTALRPFLSPDSIVAIVLNKAQTYSLEHYRRVEKFQIGKRRIIILKLI
jgi:hypothetical protein